MTREEFTSWLTEYKAAFPQTGKWIDELPARKATLGLWYETTFVNLELCDCQAVTRRMLKGDDEPGEAYERDQLPQMIASYAGHARNRRLSGPKSEFVPEYVEAQAGKKKFDLIGICTKIWDAMKGGASADEACATHLPKTNPEDEPRYRCLDCRDTGLVNVWHVTAMLAAKQGKFDKRRHTTNCVIRCRCVAGNKYPSHELIYDPEKWLRVDNRARQSEIDALHSYMRSYGVKSSDWDQWEPVNQTEGSF